MVELKKARTRVSHFILVESLIHCMTSTKPLVSIALLMIIFLNKSTLRAKYAT